MSDSHAWHPCDERSAALHSHLEHHGVFDDADEFYRRLDAGEGEDYMQRIVADGIARGRAERLRVEANRRTSRPASPGGVSTRGRGPQPVDVECAGPARSVWPLVVLFLVGLLLGRWSS